MGKTEKNVQKARENKGLLEFDVLVRVHDVQPHTEKYGIPYSDVGRAKDLGYLNDMSENNVYYDWKPLSQNFSFGVIDVSHYTFDEKYAYAHLSKDGAASYSLPKYLFERMGERKQILVGKRLS